MRSYFLTRYLEYSINFIKEYIDLNNTIEVTAGSGILARLLGIPYITLTPIDLNSDNIYEEFLYKQHKLIENIEEYKPTAIILGVYENINNIAAQVINNPIAYGISERWIIENIDVYISISDRQLTHSQYIEKLPHLLHYPTDIFTDISKDFRNVIRVWQKSKFDKP